MSGQNEAVVPAAALSSLLGPLYSDIWHAITSDLGVLTAEILGTTASPSNPSSASARMTTTIDVTIPYSTITVDSTIFKTSLVTVTVGIAPTTARVPSSTLPTLVSDTSVSSIQSPSSQVSLPLIMTTFPYSPSSQPTASSGSTTSASGVQETSEASTSSSSQSQKHAIIGGLSGAIAGFVFIGILICIILRLRRKRIDSDEASLNEKGVRPSLVRKLTQLTSGRTTPKLAPNPEKPLPQPTDGSRPATVDEDQNVIRMDTQHWPRPFVAGEGWRDSMPLGQLRVTNPDMSRPGTPRGSSDTAVAGFLRRQRSDRTRVFPGMRRSMTNSSNRHAPPQEVPEIRIDPVVAAQEVPMPWRPAPSFKSYPSISSLSIIRQHPLEDPFLTPPHDPTRPSPIPERPDYQQQQHQQESTTPIGTPPANGGVGHLLRSWGSYLNPFRALNSSSTPNNNNNSSTTPPTNLRTLSHFSTSTWSSSRPSRRSDPFDLDRPSLRGSFLPSRGASEFARHGRSSGWILYEGT